MLNRLVPILALTAGCFGGSGSTKTTTPTSPVAAVDTPPATPAGYRRVDLPGFSVDIPDDIGAGSGATTEYKSGNTAMMGTARFFTANWQPGAPASATELPALIETMAETTFGTMKFELGRTTTQQVGKGSATRLDAKLDNIDVTFINVGCGKRSVMIGFGAQQGMDAMRSQIASSFHCHPDAAQEASLQNTVPIGVDDPAVLAGFYIVPNPDMFMITNNRVIAGFLLSADDGSLDTAMLAKIAPTMFKKMMNAEWTNAGTETRRLPSGERMFLHGSMKMEGNTMNGTLTVWKCGKEAMLAIAFLADGSGLGPALDLLSKVRCPKPGDPPLPIKSR